MGKLITLLIRCNVARNILQQLHEYWGSNTPQHIFIYICCVLHLLRCGRSCEPCLN